MASAVGDLDGLGSQELSLLLKQARHPKAPQRGYTNHLRHSVPESLAAGTVYLAALHYHHSESRMQSIQEKAVEGTGLSPQGLFRDILTFR